MDYLKGAPRSTIKLVFSFVKFSFFVMPCFFLERSSESVLCHGFARSLSKLVQMLLHRGSSFPARLKHIKVLAKYHVAMQAVKLQT